MIALAKQLVAGRNATGNRDDAVERLNELVERAIYHLHWLNYELSDVQSFQFSR